MRDLIQLISITPSTSASVRMNMNYPHKKSNVKFEKKITKNSMMRLSINFAKGSEE